MNSASKRTSSIKDKVSSNSGVVSPGKPTITSLVSTTSGMRPRRAATFSRYCPLVYRRFMAPSTRSFPDWKGRWMAGATFSHRAITSNSLSVASLGWEVMKRRRNSPGTALAASSRRGKSQPPSRSLP